MFFLSFKKRCILHTTISSFFFVFLFACSLVTDIIWMDNHYLPGGWCLWSSFTYFFFSSLVGFFDINVAFSSVNVGFANWSGSIDFMI